MGDFATAWLLETVASAGEALAEAGGAVGETIETVARRASVTLLGEGDGDGIVTKTQELWLDGREQLDTMPVDSSVVAITSWEEEEAEAAAAVEAPAAGGGGEGAGLGTSPVLRSTYHYRGPGVLQEITRRLEEGGRVYRVVNEMTREGARGAHRPLVAHIIYDRVARKPRWPRARVVVVVDDDAIARCRPAAPSRGTCKASA